jgi:hypothetical protein
MSRSIQFFGWALLVLLTGLPQNSSAFLFGRRSDPKIDLMKCKSCSTPLAEENWVQLEKIEKCSPQRRFLQNDIWRR